MSLEPETDKRSRTTSYVDYVRTGWWSVRRKRFLSRARNRYCLGCGMMGTRLDVHHRSYARLWAERSQDLASFCRVCHGVIHTLEKLIAKTRPSTPYPERLRESTERIIVRGRARADGLS